MKNAEIQTPISLFLHIYWVSPTGFFFYVLTLNVFFGIRKCQSLVILSYIFHFQGEIGVVFCDKKNDNQWNLWIARLIIFICLYELRTEIIDICKHCTHTTYFNNTDSSIFDSLSFFAQNAAFGWSTFPLGFGWPTFPVI